MLQQYTPTSGSVEEEGIGTSARRSMYVGGRGALQRALDVAAVAKELDAEGDYRTALVMYRLCLQMFLRERERESNKVIKRSLGETMGEYMSRAEAIKAYLEQHPQHEVAIDRQERCRQLVACAQEGPLQGMGETAAVAAVRSPVREDEPERVEPERVEPERVVVERVVVERGKQVFGDRQTGFAGKEMGLQIHVDSTVVRPGGVLEMDVEVVNPGRKDVQGLVCRLEETVETVAADGAVLSRKERRHAAQRFSAGPHVRAAIVGDILPTEEGGGFRRAFHMVVTLEVSFCKNPSVRVPLTVAV